MANCFVSRFRNSCWTQSEPPAVAGGYAVGYETLAKAECVYDVPTRYREVVLTVSKHSS